MKRYILSIDQGTTSTRVALYNLRFKIVDIVQKELKQYFKTKPSDPLILQDATGVMVRLRR